MNASFWDGKRVFLTGHTGFKGGWLSLWLQSMGAQLTGYALAPTTELNLFEAASISLGMKSVIGDIRDGSRLAQAMLYAEPEIVIHMAAQPLVRHSYVEPVETYSTNVMGTVHLLEAIRQTPSVRSVVNVTTDKCYENKEWMWGYRENEPMGGFDPYSSSKGCAELVTAAYRSSYFNPTEPIRHHVAVATARAGNVIGGGDWSEDRLVPDVLAAFERGEPVQIRNPHATRPWQHVLEPLRGYLVLAEKLYDSIRGSDFAEAWNFGPNAEDAWSVEHVVGRLAQKWAGDASWQISAGDHPHEASYLKLDISKAESLLDWHPIMRLDEGLGLTVEWNRGRLTGADLRELTLRQIQTYQAKVANF